MDRQFGNVKLKKKSWLHLKDPFQAMLRNRLNNTLGVSSIAKNLFTPYFFLNQATQNICSEDGSYTIRNASTGQSYVPGDYIAKEQAFTNDPATTSFDAATVMNTAVVSGFKQANGIIDKPAAVLWIKPNNGMDLYDSIQAAINQAQSAAGCAAEWFIDWEGSRLGIVPFSANNALGGHWFCVCGKVNATINSKVIFPESDRMAVANTWGTDAPGSDGGYYYFSRQEVNAWLGNLGIGVWIYSNDKTINVLGQISALYTKILTLIGIA